MRRKTTRTPLSAAARSKAKRSGTPLPDDRWEAVVESPPLSNPTLLLGDFWPEDDDLDAFIAEVRPGRRQD